MAELYSNHAWLESAWAITIIYLWLECDLILKEYENKIK